MLASDYHRQVFLFLLVPQPQYPVEPVLCYVHSYDSEPLHGDRDSAGLLRVVLLVFR